MKERKSARVDANVYGRNKVTILSESTVAAYIFDASQVWRISVCRVVGDDFVASARDCIGDPSFESGGAKKSVPTSFRSSGSSCAGCPLREAEKSVETEVTTQPWHTVVL
jgi:hypothetical protein